MSTGFDRGLKMGGLCKEKESGKKGVVLGILKRSTTTAKVQWETNGETAYVPVTQLEHIEPPPFCIHKLTGITLEVLKNIARLSGITNQIKMPQCHLTPEEEKLLVPESALKERKKTRGDLFHACSSDPQLFAAKRNVAKSVESLSNEMVSNIMGEIRKMSSEKTVSQDSAEVGDADEEQKKQVEIKKQLIVKLLNTERECLQLAFLQLAALKVLNLLLTTNEYSQHFLFPSVFDKEHTDDGEKTDTIKWIMTHVVSKSVQPCKLKNIVSIAEIERAESILQLNYVKCKSEEDLNTIFNTEVTVPSRKFPQQSDCSDFRNILERPTPCHLRPSSSRFGMSLVFSDGTNGTSSK